MKYKKIREEELKNKVGAEWFKQFDTTEILGNIDFTVFPKQDSLFGRKPLLWAEAKTGNFDVATMFVQLILTIGKARTFDKTMPPAFLGAFDFQKMAFVPYINIQDIFYLNDFNWNVTSSNHGTKEFKLIKDRIESTLKQKTYVFDYEKDEKELSTFIKNNVAKATTKSKIKIDKNNFIPIYLRWLEFVKPIIDVNWEELNKANIYDSDFYLADLFVDDKGTQSIDDDLTIRDNLFVVFENQGYKIKKENIKQMFDATINLKKKETYQYFWKLYKRPPIKEFQDYIIYRKDLLVPQDIRERKGAFFTPRQWVELSQKYLTNYLGENWQDEYYIWDCAAGTGNLLAGLNNKYNIYASTLDQADVNVMYERIEHGANLLESHVFQFDFLNDDFDKLPKSLREIIFSEEKREKLIIYINPPYAEATNAKTVSRSGQNKSGVSTNYKVKEFYNQKIGNASNELFALFMAIVYEKIPHSKLAIFSKLKFIQGTNFRKFKTLFLADFVDGFISPAKTFDNVTGKFPIGFTIWDLNSKKAIEEIECDIYNKNADFIGQKVFRGNLPKSINKWIKTFDNDENRIGLMVSCAPDFQHNKQLAILSKQQKRYCFSINQSNLMYFVVYYAVRKSIPADWINDRDQFLWPNDNYLQDDIFKSDCFTYTLFDNQIESKYGTNHWIPFTETEVNAKERFESNFMVNIINGKTQLKNTTDKLLFAKNYKNSLSNEFSDEARETFNSGLELWKYYHSKENINVNASIYEIREYFQGRNDIGIMNSSSNDVIYMELISDLRDKLKTLVKKIEPKIYEYGFLQK